MSTRPNTTSAGAISSTATLMNMKEDPQTAASAISITR